jgi:hypothetical protein
MENGKQGFYSNTKISITTEGTQKMYEIRALINGFSSSLETSKGIISYCTLSMMGDMLFQNELSRAVALSPRFQPTMEHS